MSVTFSCNGFETVSSRDVPCLCAQMAEGFCPMVRGEDSPEIRASLKAEAHPDCPLCKGEGVEQFIETDSPFINLCNENAAVFLHVLGLGSELQGELTLPEARRAFMRASNRKGLDSYGREGEVLYGAPRTRDDGTVEMRPIRVFDKGRSPEYIPELLHSFINFLGSAAERGATKIFWS